MNDVLAIAMRPKSLDELIGADEVVKRIRRRATTGRIPKAWMFFGQTGSGKTTIAYILALALQCTHDKEFGAFCSRCWKHRMDFDFVEVNASEKTGKDDMADLLQYSNSYPNPGSPMRVYFLDEVHKQSDAAQNLLLKYTETCPATTKFILATTREDAVIRPLRRRCKKYHMPPLDMKGVSRLVRRGMKKIDCKLESQALIEKLLEKDITSPGLILNAVESYSEGATVEEASEVEAESEVATRGLTRQLIKGDWESVAEQLRRMTPEDVRRIQGAVSKYLLGILLGEKEFSSRARSVAKAIQDMSRLQGSDNVQMAALGAILYNVCKIFKEYTR